MGIELNLGDKVWLHYGPTMLIVGHIVDNSPNHNLIGISPLPYNDYKEMNLLEKASCPIGWYESKDCAYICHIPSGDLTKIDNTKEAPVGFAAR